MLRQGTAFDLKPINKKPQNHEPQYIYKIKLETILQLACINLLKHIMNWEDSCFLDSLTKRKKKLGNVPTKNAENQPWLPLLGGSKGNMNIKSSKQEIVPFVQNNSLTDD